MKVRHKKTGVIFETRQAFADSDGWEVTTDLGEIRRYHPDALEPIPTETWRDVTEHIDYDDYDIQHDRKIIGEWRGKHFGYRLRKIQLVNDSLTRHQWAFVVEKREP